MRAVRRLGPVPPGMRIWTGAMVAMAGVAALSGAMVPLRAHLSVATTALVLVVPVVAGVAVGGLPAGAVGVACGFLAYDFLFIPPYGTLSVGALQNWVALGVYVATMLLVSWVVGGLHAARAVAGDREKEARRLFEMSDLLIAHRPRDELLRAVAATVRQAFGAAGVALLLPSGDRLETAASDGEPFPADHLVGLASGGGPPVPLSRREDVRTVVLSAGGHPVGLLSLAGAGLDSRQDQLLVTFANHAALAVERAQLQDQAVRAGVLEEVDRWRSALWASVSHDLRTPLFSIKTAVSNLADPDLDLAPEDRSELLAMVEAETDRLARLVTELLDMTRIEAGTLQAHLEAVAVPDVVEDAIGRLGRRQLAGRLEVEVPEDLPLMTADPVLTGQVLANLLDNAGQHTGPFSPVRLQARRLGDRIEMSVADTGPGIAPEQREAIFQAFHRVKGAASPPGGVGLGLAIAKAFVEAQGGRIWVADREGGGSVFTVSLPVFELAHKVA